MSEFKTKPKYLQIDRDLAMFVLGAFVANLVRFTIQHFNIW